MENESNLGWPSLSWEVLTPLIGAWALPTLIPKLAGPELTTYGTGTLPVEHDGFGLDFSVLDVDLVSGEHDGNVLADSDQIPVPVGNVLVSHSGGHVEHDDGALTCNQRRKAQ